MRTIHYKTLKGLLRQTSYGRINLNEMRSRRFYHKTKGFVNFSLDWGEVGKFYRGIAGVVWSKVTEDRIAMVSSAKYMYILDRLWYNGKRYEYCAGQDYVGEIRHIQNELRKG